MRLRTVIGSLTLTAASALAASGDLADAAQRGNWAQVRALLASGDARFAQADGMTALHWAVQANQEEIAAALLAKGADPNAVNRYGVTPLWLAATNGSPSMTRLLLQKGANVDAAMKHGETALMAAARTGEPRTIQALLDAGADPNVRESSQGETALMWAAAENHGDAIRLLMKGGADPNQHAKALDLAPWKWMQVGMVDTMLPRGGFTALMYAARQDAQDAAKALADTGANLNEQDPDGATAVQLAIINQHYDMAILLLEKGANPNVTDNSGMTAHYAAVDMADFRSDIGRPRRKSLDKATALDVLRAALKHGGDPNIQLRKPILGRHHGFPDASLGEGATALMRAAKGLDLDSMRTLLEAGADPKLGMTNGSNAVLLVAAGRGPEKIVPALRMLAGRGANLNGANRRGETALHTAARAGVSEVVRVLAELGADLNAKDANGKTALDLVSQPGPGLREATATLLRELAAK